jgi:hypothetical protein
MARYSGDYQLDSGVIVRSVRLTVFGVNLAEPIAGSPFGGSRFETRPSFDADYLPQVLVDNIQTSRPCCEVPVNTVRHARAYYSDTLFLYIPCPYRGDTNDFLAFFRQLVDNPLIVLVESHGETVSSQYTLIFAERS